MDTIFFFGEGSGHIPMFLGKLGYSVLRVTPQQSLVDVIAQTTPDIIVVDARIASDTANLFEFFRYQETTRGVPIVCVASEEIDTAEQLTHYDHVELVPSTASVGMLASRIATRLRLRKTAGADGMQGTVAEMNLALRDYTARMKKDLEEAREIQRNLLPQKLPHDPRFQLAVSYHPRDEVGGDWYWVELQNDGAALELHISDVSGHGLPAAFLASMAKLAMVAAQGVPPDRLLHTMNAYLQPQLPRGRFITSGHALYIPDTGEVWWARAGHGPALLRRKASARVEYLYGEGYPIGFVSGEPYELVKAVLEPGDQLVFYTDGLTEAQNRDMQQFGLEYLCQVIATAPDDLTAGRTVAWIIDALSHFLDGRMLKDDVTLLLLKREI